MRVAAVLLAALAVPALARAGGPPPGWEAALSGGAEIQVTAEPVEVTPDSITGLKLRGAWELDSENEDFGGLSGLIVSDGYLYANSDVGWWFGARLTDNGTGPQLTEARLAPMRDIWGLTYSKHEGDAEGLALTDRGLAVSLERDHRIMRLGAEGAMQSPLRLKAFQRFSANKGLEGLASLPDGRLLAFAEEIDGGKAPMFLIGPDGTAREGALPLAGDEPVTGADLAPDGRLYIVRRDFSYLTGLSIVVMRFHMRPDGFPDPATAETLARFGASSGIDNMEGISVETLPSGETRLWLISDDNFSPLQNTLLVSFEIEP